MKKAWIQSIFLFIAIFSSATLVWAQGGPKALLVYADDESALTVITKEGTPRAAMMGDTIQVGETIRTGKTTAELQLDPNGSIIKLSRNTTFKIEALASGGSQDSNRMSLAAGKIRTVAAKVTGKERYEIRTPTAVCGVRGTDFSMVVEEGKRDAVYVQRGLVEFARTSGGAVQSVLVGAGQFVDVFGAAFLPAPFTMDQFTQEFQDLVNFIKLNPETVPQAEAPATQTGEEPPENTEAAVIPPSEDTTGPSEGKEKPKATESKLMGWLGDMLGFEIGSVAIDGKTYSKAVIQPVFSLGKLKMALYLPVIYTNDLFNPSTWYHPAGNNEWSFGSEYWASNPGEGALDALQDLSLKIRYIEYGDPLVDNLYFKVGNLSSMTLGHGILMRNFANDADFPSVRRVGLNAGYDAGPWALEGAINDIGRPEIFGTRVKLAQYFGITFVADINPASAMSKADQDALGNPMLLGGALDIDVPILKMDWLALRAFADVAAVAPYTRTEVAGLETGLQYKTIYDPDRGSGFDALQNYGFMTGFMGRVLFIDWRLEYRFYRGAFRPSLFDGTYERNRAQYAVDFINLAQNPVSQEATINGIYGEAGFSLIKDKITMTVGYLMPWSPTGDVSFVDASKEDYIKAVLTIKRGLIPIYDVYGSISYERTGFVYALAKGQNLFDTNTIFKGEVVVPIAPTVDLAFILANNALRNETLSITNPTYTSGPTLTIETRVHF